MTLPNFLVLGAAKAGTTALYYYLMQHPQIHVTPLKETNFFALEGQRLGFRGPGDDDYINRLSITRWEDYLEQYRWSAGKTALGEASPLYLYSPRAAERIRHYVPDAKLVAILRDPVSRAFSAFLHLIRDEREPFRDFRQALAAEPERIDAGWEHIWHYKALGLYHVQLRRFYDLFPPEQIKVFLYKDLETDPEGMLRELFGFLGVATSFIPDMTERHNAARLVPGRKPALLPGVRAELQDFFRADAMRLQDLIGRDVSHWFQEQG